jgi:transcriptional regulator with XRE-family HTH domain
MIFYICIVYTILLKRGLSMENEGERYLFVFKSSGLNKSDFAASLGISKAYGCQIATGRAKAPRQTLKRLALDYHINLNWYLYGQGEPDASEEASIRTTGTRSCRRAWPGSRRIYYQTDFADSNFSYCPI